MSMSDTYLTRLSSWQKLMAHYQEKIAGKHLADLIKSPNRIEQFSIDIPGIYVDFSKNRMQDETISLLTDLAKQQNLSSWIKKLFAGEKINDTENRAALHTVLRGDSTIDKSFAEGVRPSVEESFVKMEAMVKQIRSGHWRGATGKAITDVVNIGVGGSDLGPLMISHALQTVVSPVNIHFISSIDGTQTSNVLKKLDQETTLFIVASKSFSTIDTLSNAKTALNWLQERIDNHVFRQHFIGISASPKKMDEWGIVAQNQLLFWDWVGGRYSMWSTIGLPIALKIGMDGFREFLAGAQEMDKHFAEAEFSQNIPVMLGLIDIWNVNFLDIHQKAVLPYDARLKYLPSYLTQLVMESNGKSVDRQGRAVDYKTCPILWGEVGSNAQHAFYQLLHQGTSDVMSDFIAVSLRDDFNIESDDEIDKSLLEQHQLTLANCFAQSRVLMLGNEAIPEALKERFDSPFKQYSGNQPSNTIIIDKISAKTLGRLIALYEHKTFVESVIWNINPFDQWGVELGKLIANETKKSLSDESENLAEKLKFDVSTEALIKRVKR